MFKRILYITFLLALVGALAYFYIQVNHHSETEAQIDLIGALPNNPALIVEVNNLKQLADNQNLGTEVKQTLSSINAIASYQALWLDWDSTAQKINDLSRWSDLPAIISYHLIGKKATPFFLLHFPNKAIEKAWILSFEAKNLQTEKKYNGIAIYKLETPHFPYIYFYNGYFACSSSPILLEQSIRNLQEQPQLDQDLIQLRKTKGTGATLNCFFNYPRMQLLTSAVLYEKSIFSKRLKQLGDWGEFDFSCDDNNLIFNGFSTYKSADYWQIFAHQETQKMTIQHVIPAKSEGFVCFSISKNDLFRKDYENYLQQIETYTTYLEWQKSVNKKGVDDLIETFDLLVDGEIAFRYDDLSTSTDESLLFIQTKSASLTQEAMFKMLRKYAQAKGNNVDQYKKNIALDSDTRFDLYTFPFDDAFAFLFGDIFLDFKAKYFCIYDNYLLFGTDADAIEQAILANILKQTMANDVLFSDIFSSFSVKNSLFYFEKTANIIPTIQKNTSLEFCKEAGIKEDNLHHFYACAYQMVTSDKYVYNSILLNYNANLKDKPQTVWSSQLDAPVIGKPTFVKNHYTQEIEICVQDANHNLYLISPSGRIIWKKPIGEAIISEIQQIDYYKNDKLQLLFNTASKLWLLDRDGNYVERYPILLASKASTGLSLFDYENNRNYRIFVPTEDRHILLFTKEGNINKDFAFEQAEYPITQAIQHFRVGNKDYLVFADKNRVYILNRKGEERVKLKTQFSTSPSNPFYIGHDGQSFLATTDMEGHLRKIYFDGTVKKIELTPSSPLHYFAMDDLGSKTSTQYIITDQTTLHVYDANGKKLFSKAFDDALLSRPYFYEFASNVTEIGFVDYKHNALHLINGTDGDDYNGFPLIGTSPFSIGFLKASNWRFNLIVGGENNSLYNYKVK